MTTRRAVCVSMRCDHPRRDCDRCHASECKHALDAGICVPCQLASGRGASFVAGRVVSRERIASWLTIEFVEAAE